MKFKIITIFPGIFDSYINESIIKRASEKGLIEIIPYDLRDWTTDNHKTVDDTPYGGGAGMVMKIEPIYKALQSVRPEGRTGRAKTVLLSAKGKTWNQQMAQEYSNLDEVIFICGRYEGVDERVTELIDEEISIGDFVLTGGELGTLVMIDSITRLLPGALGNAESPIQESHSIPGQLEYPQYTRPEEFEIDGKIHKVPDILLSGHHAEIETWRKKMSKKKTA